jgi:hypothetical protein
MKLININSKRGVVNLFADYILNKINKNLDSIICVTDFNHFFIVNGITESTEILDLGKIKDEFVSEYESLLLSQGYTKDLSIMDLIKYDQKKSLTKVDQIWTTVYESTRPLYHQELIDNISNDFVSLEYNDGIIFELKNNKTDFNNKYITTPIQVSSEFPYGHSLSMGRNLMYYSELIGSKILYPSYSDKIDIFISNNKDSDGDYDIRLKFDSPVSEKSLKSLILDNFDFDMEDFNKKFDSYNFCDDIKKPTENKIWLIKDIEFRDLYIF